MKYITIAKDFFKDLKLDMIVRKDIGRVSLIKVLMFMALGGVCLSAGWFLGGLFFDDTLNVSCEVDYDECVIVTNLYQYYICVLELPGVPVE